MTNNIRQLVVQWRDLCPIRWAEHGYGWIGPDGRPIHLEPWQRAALQAWEEHRDTVTTFAVSNVKKTGKTFANAILTAWRWLTLPGAHYVAANDLDQSAGRQFGEIAEMCKRHPLLSEHVTATKTRLTFRPTGSTLEALPVDYAGAAGSNHLTVSHTEAWAVVYESGRRLWEELSPPPGVFYGLPTLRIVDSYAGFESESDVWHSLVDRGLGGERVSDDWPIYKAGGLLLFHLEGEEAQRRCFRGTPEQAEVYYDEQRADLRASAYSRQHLNKRASGESRFVSLEMWDALVKPDCRPVVRGESRPLWLGADAGTKHDAAALVGCTWNAERRRVELAYVRQWLPEKLSEIAGPGGMDLDLTLGAEIVRLNRENVVKSVACDPWQMSQILNRLSRSGVKVDEFPQGGRRAEADQALFDAITSRSLATFANPTLRVSISKAAAKESARGFRLEKRPGDDLAVALSMAHLGALRGGPTSWRLGSVDLSLTRGHARGRPPPPHSQKNKQEKTVLVRYHGSTRPVFISLGDSKIVVSDGWERRLYMSDAKMLEGQRGFEVEG